MNKKAICLAAVVVLTSAAFSAQAGEAGERHGVNYNAERFHEADTNNDGKLSREEAAAATRDFERHRGSDRFDLTDTNNDGFITLEEASARAQYEKEVGKTKSDAKAASLYNRDRFDAVDTDGDGYVSRSEAAADKKAYEYYGGARFDRADADKDGLLSFEEAAARIKEERGIY